MTISAVENKLYLASTSPRRMQLLQQIGVQFISQSPSYIEPPWSGEKPCEYVSKLANNKAKSILTNNKDAVVLAADTVIYHRNKVIGKPVDENNALSILASLSASTHQVYTGVSLMNYHRHLSCVSITIVHFNDISCQQAKEYWSTGEPYGKAGAYAIQGLGAVFVKSIEGSYSGVIGLPLAETAQLLRQFDIKVWQ